MNSKDNYTEMTSRAVRPLIGSLAVPTIIIMLTTAFYNMVDTYYVGKINTQCTAAVGISYSVMAIIQAIGFFFGHGTGNYISRQLGAKNIDGAQKMASSGVVYAAALGIVIAVLGLAFLHPLSVRLGSTPTILPYTERFLGIILLGAPFMTVMLTINTQMRFQGNALNALFGIMAGAVANVALVPLFAFTFGMGIAGAALGTVAGQLISLLLLIFLNQKYCIVSFKFRDFKPSAEQFKEILHGGLPSLCRNGLGCVSIIILNVAAAAFGDAAIAAMSIVTRFCNIVYSIVIGLGQGFQPVCGFNYGAGLYRRVLSGFWFCVSLGTAFLTVASVAGFFFSAEIINLFQNNDPAVTGIGVSALRWQLLTTPLIAWITLCNMMLQTLKKSAAATALSAARQGIFFIPLAYILPRHFGIAGVEACQAAADLLSFAVAIPLVWSTLQELRGAKR